MRSVYVLRDPDTRRIRYVGGTVRPLAHRLEDHVRDARFGGPRRPVMEWVFSLIDAGKSPIIEFVCRHRGDAYSTRVENDLIAHYTREFPDLLNRTNILPGEPVEFTYDLTRLRRPLVKPRGRPAIRPRAPRHPSPE